jgi:hypothetical protein
MLFSLRNTVPSIVKMAGECVELVENTKFLGCVIDKSLTWQHHVSSLCKKLAQGIALLRSVYYLYPMWVKRMIYFSYFYSHISYCIAIWGNAAKVHTNRVLVMQKKAIRLMLGLPYNEHVKPHAVANYLLLFDDVYKLALAFFAFRYCILKCNYNLFYNAGYVLTSANNASRVTRSSVQHNFFLPYMYELLLEKMVS